ncbi:MAG: hypothetical protein ACP5N1_03545 [Candidatus Woesearchaeota archaeon]
MNTEWKTLTNADATEQIAFNPEKLFEIEEFFARPIEKRMALVHSVRGAVKEEPKNVKEEPTYIKDLLEAVKEEPKYVKDLLENAHNSDIRTYIPIIHNFQKDPTHGVNICNTMRYVIENSGKVALIYNPSSEGSKFDLGITLFNNKDLIILNSKEGSDDELTRLLSWYSKVKYHQHQEPSGKYFLEEHFNGNLSIKNFISDNIENPEALYENNDRIRIKLDYIARTDAEGKPMCSVLSPKAAVSFGMVYASRKGFTLINHEDVEIQKKCENNYAKNKIISDPKNDNDDRIILPKLEETLKFSKSYSQVALIMDKVYNPWRK